MLAAWTFISSPLGKWIMGIVGVVLLLTGLYFHGRGIGYDAAEAKYKPALTEMTGQRDQALAANSVLQKDVEEIRDRFNKLDAEGKRRQAAATKAMADERQRGDAALAALNAERTTVARPKSTEACDGICARAYKLLGDLIAGSLQPDSP